MQIKAIRRQDVLGLWSICKVLFLWPLKPWQNVNICQISAMRTQMCVILFSTIFSMLEISYNKLSFKIGNKKTNAP
jgi:hypothetical protein